MWHTILGSANNHQAIKEWLPQASERHFFSECESNLIVQVVDKCGDKAVEFDTKALGEGIQIQRNTFLKKLFCERVLFEAGPQHLVID